MLALFARIPLATKKEEPVAVAAEPLVVVRGFNAHTRFTVAFGFTKASRGVKRRALNGSDIVFADHRGPNHRRIRSFRESHQEPLAGRQSLNRLREEVFWRCSVRVAEIALQACSFNHSDISPFRVNDLRGSQGVYSAHAGPVCKPFCDHADAQRVNAGIDRRTSEFVSDLLVFCEHLASARPTLGQLGASEDGSFRENPTYPR